MVSACTLKSIVVLQFFSNYADQSCFGMEGLGKCVLLYCVVSAWQSACMHFYAEARFAQSALLVKRGGKITPDILIHAWTYVCNIWLT